MNDFSRAAALLSITSLLGACAGGGTTNLSPAVQPPSSAGATARGRQPAAKANYFPACGEPLLDGQVRCHALVRNDIGSAAIAQAPATTDSTGPFRGLTPEDLHAAYNIPKTGGANRTIGIVDALDDPLAESDLAKYRAHFHLPPCTTANGCFRKLNQDGIAGKYPSSSVTWTYEISLVWIWHRPYARDATYFSSRPTHRLFKTLRPRSIWRSSKARRRSATATAVRNYIV